eukprot:UN00461
MDTIKLLTENDLKEMIDKVGPRRLIYNAIQELNVNKPSKKVDNDDTIVSKPMVAKKEWLCVVCGTIGDKNTFFVIDNKLCCDDCYKWCSKHNQRCFKNSGEISFGTNSWYCYKCMIQCRCGTWWRPNEMNYNGKGSGIIVKCLVCEGDVRM